VAKRVVLDELRVTVRIPNDLSEAQTEAVNRTVHGKDFMAALRRAIQATFRAFPELDPVRVTLSR
jgi:hypothetical protein